MTVNEVLKATDWKLLRNQKMALILATENEKLGPLTRELLEGLLTWVEAIQDGADADGHPVVFITEYESNE